MEEKRLDTSFEKCDGCGGNLAFNPAHQALHCENCGSVKKFDKDKNYEKHSVSSAPKAYEGHEDWVKSVKVTNCSNCGSQIVFEQHKFADVCPYCGSNYVTDSNSLPALAPDAVIPFKFDTSKASEEFALRVKKKIFVISEFKKKLPEKDIQGVYIPSFAFDSDSKSSYSGVLLEHETRRSGDRTYTTTKRINIKGEKQLQHRDITIESSSLINQSNLNSILPYNMGDGFKFDENFIRGYAVEHFDTQVDKCFKVATNVMDNDIRNAILRQYHYDEVERLDVKTVYSNEVYAYRLLPLYRFEYNYKNKQYITYMNGQTGKIGGKLPYSKIKIAFAVILGILVFLIPIILALVLGE